MPSADLPLRFVSGRPTLDSDALLANADPLRAEIYAWLAERCRSNDASLVVGLESWGYLFAAPTALATGVGLAVARRRVDRLGEEAVTMTYDMNRAQGNAIGMERGVVQPGARALLVDDSVVSGRTLGAVAKIVEELQGEVVGACAITGSRAHEAEARQAIGAPLHCYRWA
ncbi:MAG TPA: phosphoribosyltransferase family protein [Solirubrobacterales bacterium]|nr:phosphoribosyltransferase family protein [Solirubrobacterales bacterium]